MHQPTLQKRHPNICSVGQSPFILQNHRGWRHSCETGGCRPLGWPLVFVLLEQLSAKARAPATEGKWPFPLRMKMALSPPNEKVPLWLFQRGDQQLQLRFLFPCVANTKAQPRSETSARVQGTPRTRSQHQRWNIFHKGVKAALDPPGAAGDTEGWTGPQVLPGLRPAPVSSKGL